MIFPAILLHVLLAACESMGYAPTDAERARWTMHDMRSITIAAEAYRTDHGALPEAASLDELTPMLSPMYIATMPKNDAWGTPLRVESSADGLRVISAGSDARFDPETWTLDGPLTSFADDAMITGPRQFRRMWRF